MERALKDMRLDCVDAFNRARPYHLELQSIYRYMMPWRQPTLDRALGGGGQTEGASITDYIFDATGISAAANFAGTMSEDWMPLNREFMKLQAGPFLPEGVDRDAQNKIFENVTERVHAISERAKVTAQEAFYDFFGGTGAMFCTKGNQRTILDSVAPPIVEIATEEGPTGDIWDIYWKRAYRYRDLPALWPKGTFSDTINQGIKNTPREYVEVIQYTHYDPVADRWLFNVWSNRDQNEDTGIWSADYNVSPWMIFRMFKMPGERMGRGLAHLALPFVKTANRGRELALKAAVFAILGIWLRRNDSVFNPDTATFDPGAMWTVSQTGGPYASLARLPVPNNFDITSVVMSEEREQIRRVLLDDELPDENDPIRSPTEIAARVRRNYRRRGGTGGRIGLELITPYAQRACDILQSHNMLGGARITIDQIVTRCIVTAPAAAAQRADAVEGWVSYMQIISMLFGPEVAMLLTKADAIPEMGRNLGIPEKHLPDKQDLERIRDVLANVAAQMHAARANGAGGQPGANGATPPASAAPYLNGGVAA